VRVRSPTVAAVRKVRSAVGPQGPLSASPPMTAFDPLRTVEGLSSRRAQPETMPDCSIKSSAATTTTEAPMTRQNCRKR
jgi:hypothetical protein